MRLTTPLACLLLCSQAHATPGKNLRATVFNEAIAIPFTALATTPVHPGFMAGTSLMSVEGQRLDHRLHLDVGFYHHPLMENAVFVLPTWQSTWWLAPRLGVSGIAGVGYKHAFYPNTTYSSENGTSSEQFAWGHPEITTTLGFGVKVPINNTWALIAQYRGSLDGPFSKELGMPAMTHITTHIGVEYRR